MAARNEILNKLKAALTHEAHLNMHEIQMNIDIEDGVLVLSGEVEHIAAKKRAVELASEISEITEEDNDLELGDNLLRILEKDPYIDATQIQVRVQDQVATLTGAVPGPSERNMVESDAWFMPGVKNVINQIQVIP